MQNTSVKCQNLLQMAGKKQMACSHSCFRHVHLIIKHMSITLPRRDPTCYKKIHYISIACGSRSNLEDAAEAAVDILFSRTLAVIFSGFRCS